MMYPRIKIAKDLLTDDGIMLISIDESEFDNLKKICSEIFGQQNYIGEFVWENRTVPNDADNMFAMTNEYIVIFAKNKFKVSFNGIKKELSNYTNPDNDPNGHWIKDNPSAASGNPDKDRFPITNPYTGEVYFPPKGRFWGFSQKRVEEWTKSGKLVFSKELGKNFILKKYATELKSLYQPIGSVIKGILTMHATKEMKKLFPEDGRVFKYPKPTELIKYFISQIPGDDFTVLDFFSGSATTAHATMKLNAEDGGKRKYILVQLQEECDESSEAYRAGYKNICEVAKERIRRAGKNVLENKPKIKDLDIGFRNFVIDSSNMNDVFYNPNTMQQSLLDLSVDNIKNDRTEMDLLFQVMIECGTDLTKQIEKIEINNQIILSVNNKELIACFDKDIDNVTITKIAQMQPKNAVFRENCFKNDSSKINLKEIFNRYSKETKVKVL